MNQIRQGDILLVACDVQPPTGLKANHEVILAEGELTGHAHRLTGKTVLEWSVGDQQYIRVTGGVGELSHEDHDPKPAAVVDPDKTYRVIRQNEMDLSGQWRPVQD